MGKAKKIELSVVYFMRFCVPGAMWILYGILNLFDDESLPLKIVSTVCMFLSIAIMLLSWLVKQDKEDDASRLHLMKACTVTLFIALTVVMGVSVISAFYPKSIFDFNILYPFVIGMIMVFIGGIFIYCEKWGEDTWH